MSKLSQSRLFINLNIECASVIERHTLFEEEPENVPGVAEVLIHEKQILRVPP